MAIGVLTLKVFGTGLVEIRFSLVMVRDVEDVEDDADVFSASVERESNMGGVGLSDVGRGGSGTNAESFIISDGGGLVERLMEVSLGELK